VHDLACWGVLGADAACGTANWTVNWGVNFVKVVTTTLASDKRPQLLLLL
jgi:hypothetical protein